MCILIRVVDAGRFKRFHQILSTKVRFECSGGQHSPRWSGWRRKIKCSQHNQLRLERGDFHQVLGRKF